MNSSLLKSIEKGKSLKKTKTNDRSAPIVEGATVAIGSAVASNSSSIASAGNSIIEDHPPVSLGGLFQGGMPTLRKVGSETSKVLPKMEKKMPSQPPPPAPPKMPSMAPAPPKIPSMAPAPPRMPSTSPVKPLSDSIPQPPPMLPEKHGPSTFNSSHLGRSQPLASISNVTTQSLPPSRSAAHAFSSEYKEPSRDTSATMERFSAMEIGGSSFNLSTINLTFPKVLPNPRQFPKQSKKKSFLGF
ncbi:WAS/WASL-interacting protein member 1 [Mitosporidium daphniae]